MAATKAMSKEMTNKTGVSNQELKALIAQRDELERQIDTMRATERQDAVHTVSRLIAEFDISAAEAGLGGRGRPVKRVRAAVAPKFRDPDTGSTWSGRGKPPRWIAGKDRAAFAI